jgi:ribonuclease-3
MMMCARSLRKRLRLSRKNNGTCLKNSPLLSQAPVRPHKALSLARFAPRLLRGSELFKQFEVAVFSKKFMTFDHAKIEKILGVVFADKNLLMQAFIHRSYLNEHPEVKLAHNERLEFLGDAVLELITTDFLYRTYKDKAEGELTSLRSALVNTNTISSVASKLDMNDFLLLSKGEAKDTGRARAFILANTFESVVGAIYMDQGYEAARGFVATNLIPLADEIIEKKLWLDPKSYFQERAQEVAGVTPSYKVLSETGPDHAKTFTVGIYLGSELVVEGSGASKQEAEQDAAKLGLEKKGWR